MGMINAVRRAYSNYSTLQGRATRSDYWWFLLYQWLVYIFLVSVCVFASDFFKSEYFFTPLILFVLLNVIPSFTILVRRLHDSSKSGYWLLLLLLTAPCFLVILIFTLLPSDGDNRYGADPHNIRNFNEI
uniref:DUF805 domain-containing protein n=1 Tax=Prevotella sp. TaxID=59823 RepID=UPI003FF08846